MIGRFCAELAKRGKTNRRHSFTSALADLPHASLRTTLMANQADHASLHSPDTLKDLDQSYNLALRSLGQTESG